MGFRSVGLVGLSVFYLRLTMLALLVALSLAAVATIVIIIVAFNVGIATPHRHHYRPYVSLQISCVLCFIFLSFHE